MIEIEIEITKQVTVIVKPDKNITEDKLKQLIQRGKTIIRHEPGPSQWGVITGSSGELLGQIIYGNVTKVDHEIVGI